MLFRSGRENVILLGDQTSDLLMVDENEHEEVLKIGILTDQNNLENFSTVFDIVLEESEDYVDLKNELIGKEN